MMINLNIYDRMVSFVRLNKVLLSNVLLGFVKFIKLILRDIIFVLIAISINCVTNALSLILINNI